MYKAYTNVFIQNFGIAPLQEVYSDTNVSVSIVTRIVKKDKIQCWQCCISFASIGFSCRLYETRIGFCNPSKLPPVFYTVPLVRNKGDTLRMVLEIDGIC